MMNDAFSADITRVRRLKCVRKAAHKTYEYIFNLKKINCA